MRVRCSLAVLLLGWAAGAQAIVNVESLRSGEPAPGWSGSLNLAADGESGNSDKFAVNTGGRLQWHQSGVTNFALLRYTYGETNGLKDTDKLFAHARHIQAVSKRTAHEEFAQAERDPFARLSFRGLLGAGVRLTLAEIPEVRTVHLGLGGFFSREKLEERPGLNDGGSEDIWRFNTYLNYVRRLNNTVRVLSTTYYQPAVNDFGDFRLLEEATLSVRMSDRLALNLSLNLTHDSRPPQTVDNTDTVYSTGIEYSF